MDIQVLINEVRPLYAEADTAHDFSHILRVLKWARAIGEKEGARMEILVPAALLHDAGCAPKHLGKSGDSNDESLRVARGFLEDKGFPAGDVEEILYAVEVHGYSKGVVPKTLEARVLQDADRLDALGAVGIARTFLVGGGMNRPMYNPEDPFCRDRRPDDKLWNLDHFYRKLLRLERGMHTDAGRELARERTEVMKRYLDDLRREIE